MIMLVLLTVMTLPTTIMTVFLVTMMVMTLARRSALSPPITVTLLPISPVRQYNTRDRQLVCNLNRLPIMLPLSGALYVTFNSVQIDFVYFIFYCNGFTLWRAQKQAMLGLRRLEKVVLTKLQEEQ